MTSIQNTAQALRTVVGIPVAPYRPDGELDEHQIRVLADRLVTSGVRALTANGNTGEFYALAPRERRAAVTGVIEGVDSRATVIAGVGLDLATAVDEAQFAVEEGADAIMVHQPVLPYMSPQGWVDYVATIAQAVPDHAVVPYVSSPVITGAAISELAQRCVNVVGLKYSVPDPVGFARTVQESPTELLWIAGLAESYAPSAWQSGAQAFTSGLVNVDPQISLDLLSALQRQDREGTLRLWRQIREFEDLRGRNRDADNVSVVKEAMHQRGLCDRSVRPPSAPLNPEGQQAVLRILAVWEESRA
ncbi:dihydrodipicolinate synthase family protein [Nesterenkonia halotolerans]|uniref:4-hydroxy-tetrahydrodipicolinate synthase n=1 Tax=Nesterenkonia halotolerans TaxID=225325 RepID=A0ABR9J8J1_9MICC|nr:dihydrodipicolinate synthase family protein [Nesterenkonia halotolerans]MBE1514901.1 4-hydroxy-tetrahydrodipicolinate synthase [Nesterenkonia halotolerans]